MSSEGPISLDAVRRARRGSAVLTLELGEDDERRLRTLLKRLAAHASSVGRDLSAEESMTALIQQALGAGFTAMELEYDLIDAGMHDALAELDGATLGRALLIDRLRAALARVGLRLDGARARRRRGRVCWWRSSDARRRGVHRDVR